MTNRLDRLEGAALLRRVDDPQDRRGVLIELTAKGLRRVDSVLTHHLRTEAQLIAALTLPQQERLVDLLRRLLIARGDSEPVSKQVRRSAVRVSARRRRGSAA